MYLLSLLIHLIHPCWIQLFKKSIFTDPKIWNGSIIVEINTVPRKQAFIKGFVIYPGIRHDTSIEIQVVQSVVPVGRKKYVLNKFKLNNALKLIYSYFIYNIYLTLYFNQTRGFKCALKWHLICLTLHTFLPGNSKVPKLFRQDWFILTNCRPGFTDRALVKPGLGNSSSRISSFYKHVFNKQYWCAYWDETKATSILLGKLLQVFFSVETAQTYILVWD